MKRIAMLLYGVLCYAIGMGALVYLILFTVGLLVPVTVDSGAPAPLALGLLVNVGLVALFGLQHGIMARHGFKAAWTNIVPAAAERSTFVAATGLVVAVLVLFWQPVAGSVWSVENETARIVLYAVALGGFGFTAASSFIIDHFDLFGLRQVWLNFRGRPYTHVPMKTSLVYNNIRHPLMTGLMIGFWATPEMTVSHLILAVSMTVYILIGVAYEERDLIRAFGQSYSDYRARVPAYFPHPFKRGAKQEGAGQNPAE
jgi:protein-S-isoprenylcysteine O-methyltransferase Ste14